MQNVRMTPNSVTSPQFLRILLRIYFNMYPFFVDNFKTLKKNLQNSQKKCRQAELLSV